MGKKSEFFSESKHNQNFDGNLIDEKAKHASLRPNGSINTHPQERMRAAKDNEKE